MPQESMSSAQSLPSRAVSSVLHRGQVVVKKFRLLFSPCNPSVLNFFGGFTPNSSDSMANALQCSVQLASMAAQLGGAYTDLPNPPTTNFQQICNKYPTNIQLFSPAQRLQEPVWGCGSRGQWIWCPRTILCMSAPIHSPLLHAVLHAGSRAPKPFCKGFCTAKGTDKAQPCPVPQTRAVN